MSALKAHPKVYWIWNHRRWCLEQIPYGPGQISERDFAGWKQSAWDRELAVAEKMLDVDARNCKVLPGDVLVLRADYISQFMLGAIGDMY